MPTTQPLTQVYIYTDGGCDPNPGPGGWGAVLIGGSQTREISGAASRTTSNRMELTAAIEALRVLQRSCAVVVHTDSQYLHRGITEWLPAWQRRGWRRANGRPVKNLDLWQDLLGELGRHRIDWHWVKGHSGNPHNERADYLATEARQGLLARSAGREVPRDRGRESAVEHSSLPGVDIFARACALGAPGPGGYAAILAYAHDSDRDVSGASRLATSNVMELRAVVAGLEALEQPSRVTLHTASKYVLEGATRWLAEWERRDWHAKDGKPVKNKEIWLELVRAMAGHDVVWEPLSERSDRHGQRAAKLARARAERMKLSQST